jgi:hypothetical protein
MDIRFCTVCNESIPDGEFDAGRAIVSGKHSQHVACALRRSVVMSGTRSWLTFFLALFAAGVATFLLVAHLGRDEGPPEIVELPDVVQAHVQDELLASEQRQRALLDQRAASVVSNLQSDFDTRVATLLEEKIQTAVGAQGKRITEQARETQGHFTEVNRHLGKLQERMAALLEWKVAIEDKAKELRKDIDDAANRQPPARMPDPVDVQPDGGAPAAPAEVDQAREEEIDRWIKRLKDPDEDIVFSATIELARLKALRATPDLILVLSKHKDFYARLGAATALGDIKACDAVPALIEALGDKDDLVRTAAAEALHLITEQDHNFVSGLSKSERVRIQKRWRTWWRENEGATRARLSQPATGK